MAVSGQGGNPGLRNLGDGPLAGSRILVAEDEIVIAMYVQTVLEENGAAVIGPCHSLPECLDLAAKENLTACILDMHLGPESSEPLARRLVERGVPILFYTGRAAPDAIRSQWPNSSVLVKPADGHQLVEALLSLMRHART